jgi:hypothetical protein
MRFSIHRFYQFFPVADFLSIEIEKFLQRRRLGLSLTFFEIADSRLRNPDQRNHSGLSQPGPLAENFQLFARYMPNWRDVVHAPTISPIYLFNSAATSAASPHSASAFLHNGQRPSAVMSL